MFKGEKNLVTILTRWLLKTTRENRTGIYLGLPLIYSTTVDNKTSNSGNAAQRWICCSEESAKFVCCLRKSSFSSSRARIYPKTYFITPFELQVVLETRTKRIKITQCAIDRSKTQPNSPSSYTSRKLTNNCDIDGPGFLRFQLTRDL